MNIRDIKAIIDKNRVELIGLAAILIVAGFFYFYHITEKGILGQDEAHYAILSNTYSNLLKLVGSHFLRGGNLDIAGMIKSDAFAGFWTFGRPLFIFLNAVSFFFFGRHDYVAFATNGVLGLLSIVVLYFIAGLISRDGYFPLFASFVFAISGYQIFFARSAYSQVLAGLLLLLGTLFYLKSLYPNDTDDKLEHRNLIFAGVFFGLMFTAHYNAAAVLPLVFVFECARAVSGSMSARRLVYRIMFIFVPIVVVLLVTAVLIGFKNYLLINAGMPNAYKIFSYYKEIVALYLAFTKFEVAHQDYLFYFRMINIMNGWPWLTMLLISPVIFLYKKISNPRLSFIFFMTFSALIVFSLLRLRSIITIIVLNGFVSLVVAWALYETLKSLKRNYSLINFVIIFWLLIIQLPKDLDIIRIKANYNLVAEYLITHHLSAENIFSQDTPVLSFYLKKTVGSLKDDGSKLYVPNEDSKTAYFVVNAFSGSVLVKEKFGDQIKSLEPIALFSINIPESEFARDSGYMNHYNAAIYEAEFR